MYGVAVIDMSDCIVWKINNMTWLVQYAYFPIIIISSFILKSGSCVEPHISAVFVMWSVINKYYLFIELGSSESHCDTMVNQRECPLLIKEKIITVKHDFSNRVGLVIALTLCLPRERNDQSLRIMPILWKVVPCCSTSCITLSSKTTSSLQRVILQVLMSCDIIIIIIHQNVGTGAGRIWL